MIVKANLSKRRRRTFTVTVLCCTDGNCHACRGGRDLSLRKSRVIGEYADRAEAEQVAENWSAYGAKVGE